MTYRTSVDSGELRIYVYGSLRADSKPVVREINALRRGAARAIRPPPGRALTRPGADPEAITWRLPSSSGHQWFAATSAARRKCRRCATIAGGRAARTRPAFPGVGGEVVRPRRQRSGPAECPGPPLRRLRSRPSWNCRAYKPLACGRRGRYRARGDRSHLCLAELDCGADPSLTGGISAAWAYLRVRRAAAQVRMDMPVPLHPKVADVRLIEQLRGEITLGSHDEEYQTVLKPVQGKISMILTFGRPDRDRVWRRQKRLSMQDAEVRYCAGRLVFQGQFGIRVGEQVDGPVLALDGDARDHSVFRAEDPPSSACGTSPGIMSCALSRTSTRGRSGSPLRSSPSRTATLLELDIQWVEFGPDGNKSLSSGHDRRAAARVPGELGRYSRLGNSSGGKRPATSGERALAEGCRSLELKRICPSKWEREDQERQATRLTLSIRFGGGGRSGG